MRIWNKLFGKTRPTESEIVTPNVLEVPNDWGIGDGTPLVVERRPDVRRIFSDPDPPSPQQITDRNQEYWKDADTKTKRVGLAIAYMQHPDPAVREATIEIAGHINAIGVYQALVDRLADQDPTVCQSAARTIWNQHRHDQCKFAVHALRDEIRGHAKMAPGLVTTAGLTLGRDKAIRALDVLVEEAPDEDARKAIQELIDRDVVIEERVKPVDTSSVEFVGMDYRDARFGQRYTYEVYRAKNRQQALAFLKSKVVRKKLHYIEVDTPEGTFGRDINGMYES